MKSIFSIGKDFDRYKDEVNRHNGNMIEIMVYGGILMTILAILAQLFMGYLSAMLLAVRMLIYMLILVLLRRPVLSKIQNKTLLIYLLQAPILFTVLLMGTFMDPNHQAITIFVFVSVLPLLILDKPWRVAGWTAGWLLFFVICSYCLKESGHFRGDLLYSLEFGFSSTMVAIAIIVVRMRAIKNYIEAMPPVEDPLTGALNIYGFLSYSGDYLRRYRAGSKTPCIICIDVMNMKRYNSTFGYQKGSELLLRIADVLRDRFEGEPVARFSEDHFVILTTMEERDMKLMQIHAAERSLDEPIMDIHLATGTYQITGDEEIGIACDRAQLACDVVKREKERHPSRGFSDGIYDTALAEAQEKQEYVLSHIDEAIEKGWLTVYFQPIVRSVSGELCNEEALARWIDPKYGFLSPVDFIPPLEERGLNYKVDLYIVKLVLDILKQRKVDGLPLLPISVNLSRTDFVKADMVNEISKLCDHAGIDHRLINIEITESSLAYQEEILKGEIKRFHENGFKVWMDDFGSGYSTLNVLKEYDFDLLKFDMRFVHEMTRGSKAEIILSDLVNMAKQLGIATLAEGVETEEQYRFLRDIGCEYIQGYYYGKPMTLHDLMPHVISKGLTVETQDQRKFYDKAAHEPISVDDEMGFIIDDGEKFEVLFLNAPFRNLCQKMGVKSYDVADLMSKRQDPWSKQIVITANRAKETNETEVTFITYEDYYLQVRFKKVASGQGKTLLRMNVLNLSENRRLDVRYYDSALRYMVASFDCVYIVDMATHDSYVVRSMFSSEANGSTVRNVDLAFQFHLDPLDVERVNQVLNAENIRERLRSTKKVKFTEYFRMLDEDGNSEWYAGTVISVPGVKLDSLLFTIEKTDANFNKSFMQ